MKINGQIISTIISGIITYGIVTILNHTTFTDKLIITSMVIFLVALYFVIGSITKLQTTTTNVGAKVASNTYSIELIRAVLLSKNILSVEQFTEMVNHTDEDQYKEISELEEKVTNPITREEARRRKELTTKFEQNILTPSDAVELQTILEKEKEEASKIGDFGALIAIIILIVAVAAIAALARK